MLPPASSLQYPSSVRYRSASPSNRSAYSQPGDQLRQNPNIRPAASITRSQQSYTSSPGLSLGGNEQSPLPQRRAISPNQQAHWQKAPNEYLLKSRDETDGSWSQFSASVPPARAPCVQASDLIAQPSRSSQPTALQTELQDLRRALESKYAQAQSTEVSALQKSFQLGDDQCKVQQVEQVEPLIAGALEKEVKELCAAVAGQQAEQAVFLHKLRDEVDALQVQVQSFNPSENKDPGLGNATSLKIEGLCQAVSSDQQWKLLQEKTLQSVHSELDTLSNDLGILRQHMQANRDLAACEKETLDAEIKQLRLEVDGKISLQEAQLESWQAEIQHMQAWGGAVADLRAHHGSLIKKLESEIENFRHTLGEEVQATNTIESELDEFRRNFKESRNEVHGVLHKLQKDVESAQMNDEDNMKAAQVNSDLLMQTQADVSCLRELLGRNSIKHDQKLRQESLEMIRSVQEEVEQLRSKHADLQADLTNIELSAIQQQLQTESSGQSALGDGVQTPGQESVVTVLKGELETLKLQIAMQRSLRTAEVAKEAEALQGRMRRVVESEREARIQDSAEVRAMMKSLHREIAELTQNFRPEAAMTNGASERAGASRCESADFRKQGAFKQPRSPRQQADGSIKHLEVTHFIGTAPPGDMTMQGF